MAGEITRARPLTKVQTDALLRRTRGAITKIDGVKVVRSAPKAANFAFTYDIDALRALRINISITPVDKGQVIAQIVTTPGRKP